MDGHIDLWIEKIMVQQKQCGKLMVSKVKHDFIEK